MLLVVPVCAGARLLIGDLVELLFLFEINSYQFLSPRHPCGSTRVAAHLGAGHYYIGTREAAGDGSARFHVPDPDISVILTRYHLL